jgi:hypothetical protein
LPSKARSWRMSDEYLARFQACADRAGLSLNRWGIRAMVQQADLEEAEAREQEQAIAERERVRSAAFPQGPKCPCVGIPSGGYCYRCNTKKW